MELQENEELLPIKNIERTEEIKKVLTLFGYEINNNDKDLDILNVTFLGKKCGQIAFFNDQSNLAFGNILNGDENINIHLYFDNYDGKLIYKYTVVNGDIKVDIIKSIGESSKIKIVFVNPKAEYTKMTLELRGKGFLVKAEDIDDDKTMKRRRYLEYSSNKATNVKYGEEVTRNEVQISLSPYVNVSDALGYRGKDGISNIFYVNRNYAGFIAALINNMDRSKNLIDYVTKELDKILINNNLPKKYAMYRNIIALVNLQNTSLATAYTARNLPVESNPKARLHCIDLRPIDLNSIIEGIYNDECSFKNEKNAGHSPKHIK